MRTWFASILAAVAAATFAFSCPAAARPISIRALAAQELRLAVIAYEMAAANAATCYGPEIITGMVLHDLTRYDRSVRPAVSRAFSLNGGFGVLGTVPGSVAAEAGLRVDDEIVGVNGLSVEDHAAEDAPKSYHRMDQFNALLQAAASKFGRTELLVRRGGNLLRLSLRAKFGCGGKLTLTSSSTLNAWSDGKHIVVTSGMVGLSRSDDEIAFVIAHEMAHNVLGHSGEGEARRGIFGFSRVKRGEIEADSFAVSMMQNAGYKPAGAISFLQNARRRLWWNISLDHPSFASRIKIVTAAMHANKRSSAQLASAAANLANAPALPIGNAPQRDANNRRFAALAVVSTTTPLLDRASKGCER